MLDTIVGFAALGMSVFAIVISMVFYFNSDKLYKEMLKCLTEIKTYTSYMSRDIIEMLKETLSRGWNEKDDEEIGRIKEESLRQINDGFEKLKQLITKDVELEQLTSQINEIESKFSLIINQLSQKIVAVSKEADEKLVNALTEFERDLKSRFASPFPHGKEYFEEILKKKTDK